MCVISGGTDESTQIIGVIRRETRVRPVIIRMSIGSVSKHANTFLCREIATLLKSHFFLSREIVITTRETTLVSNDDVAVVKIETSILELHTRFRAPTDVIMGAHTTTTRPQVRVHVRPTRLITRTPAPIR